MAKKKLKPFDKVVVVDPGKNQVKVLGFSNKMKAIRGFTFPSVSRLIRKRVFDNQDASTKSFQVKHGNKRYTLGEGVRNGTFNMELTKNNIHHMLCIYTAVGLLVTKKDEEVYLSVGYPSSDFDNESYLEEYRNMILGDNNGNIEIEINGELKSFHIAQLDIHPEGQVLMPRLFMKSPEGFRVIDIGGQNVNYREYDGKGNTIRSFSLDRAGMNYIAEHVKTELRKYLPNDRISLEHIDFMEVIRTRKIPKIEELNVYGKDVSEFVEVEVLDFMDRYILKPLQGNDVDLFVTNIPTIFSGGGALTLDNYLREELELDDNEETFFSETARWDNALSYAIRTINQIVDSPKDRGTVIKYIRKRIRKDDFELKFTPLKSDSEFE